LHFGRQTQRRPDFADCQTDTMEARHCILLDRHDRGQTLQIVGHTLQRPGSAFRTPDMSDGETDRHSGGQTLQIVRRKKRRIDIADFDTDTMVANVCSL
jgi:hypothetical protein